MPDIFQMCEELAEFVTAEPYSGYVDDIALELSAQAGRIEFLQSQQDAAQTSRNDSVDDEAELEGKLAAAEARAVASEERASGLEFRNKELRQDLVSSRSASIGVQMIVDASRGRIHVWEVEQIAAKSLGASAKDLVHDLRKTLKDLEIVASRQYEIASPSLMEQNSTIQGRDFGGEELTAEIVALKQLAAVKRIQGVARKKFGLLEAPMAPAPTPAPAPASAGEELRIELDEKEADDDYDWNKELDSRRKSGSLKLGFVEESGVMKEEIIGTDGGKENLDLTEEEKEEADRLKKERQREEMREKLKKQKDILRVKKAEDAARRAAESPKIEPEPEPEPMNDFAMDLLGLSGGGDAPEPESSDSDSDSSEGGIRFDDDGNPIFSGSDSGSDSDGGGGGDGGNPMFDGSSDSDD